MSLQTIEINGNKVLSMHHTKTINPTVKDLPALSDDGNKTFSRDFMHLLSIGAIGVVCNIDDMGFLGSYGGMKDENKKILLAYTQPEDFSQAQGAITDVTHRTTDNYIRINDFDSSSDLNTVSAHQIANCLDYIVAFNHPHWDNDAKDLALLVKELEIYKDKRDSLEKQITSLKEELQQLDSDAQLNKDTLKYLLKL